MNLFVWDFHGTLEQGNELAVLEITNHVLALQGHTQRLSETDCQRLYGALWYEYFEHVLPQEPYERHVQLQEAAFRHSHDHPEILRRHTKPNRHAHFVLDSIAENGHDQIVVSNTLPASLDLFLETVNMKKYFPDGRALAVNSHARQPARTKQDVLREFLAGKEYQKIISIGDSPKDVELATVHGGVSYLYTHHGRPFRDCQAHHRIRDLRDVLQEVQQEV